jgi:CheY-like chemotaxis protein
MTLRPNTRRGSAAAFLLSDMSSPFTPPPGSQLRVSPPRILLVEDEPEVSRALWRQIRVALPGCRIQLAVNRREALQAISRGGIDAVITDLDLGADNGEEILDRLTAYYPTILRVVYSARADHEGARDLGVRADRVFGKAGGPEPLLSYLSAALMSSASAPRGVRL